MRGRSIEEWSAALGRLPSGLFILTAAHQGQETGMLASWVQQCSFDPPLVSVALRRDRAVIDWLAAGAPFAAHILDEANGSPFIRHFGKGFDPGEPAFTGLEVLRDEAPAPVLAGALAYLDCRFLARHPAGDHDLVLARVVGGRLLREGRPMVHVRRNGLKY